jgi:hypothetical protein
MEPQRGEPGGGRDPLPTANRNRLLPISADIFWAKSETSDLARSTFPFLRGGEEHLQSILRTVCCETGIAGTIHTLVTFAALDPRRRAAAPPGRAPGGS